MAGIDPALPIDVVNREGDEEPPLAPFIRDHPPPRTSSRTCSLGIFYANLVVISIGILVLYIIGLNVSHHSSSHAIIPSLIFHHDSAYIFIITLSIGISAVISFASLALTILYPSIFLVVVALLAPTLSLTFSILLALHSTILGYVLCVCMVLFSLVTAWLAGMHVFVHISRLRRVLTFSVSLFRNTATCIWFCYYILYVLLLPATYCYAWSLGLGGVYAIQKKGLLVIILLFLPSMIWTMQVLRNLILVAISHVVYTQLTHRPALSIERAFDSAYTFSFPEICFGSAVIPFSTLMRLVAMVPNTFFGVQWELPLSYASIWGFVHIGANQKDYLAGSRSASSVFKHRAMSHMDYMSSVFLLWRIVFGEFVGILCYLWMYFTHREYSTIGALHGFTLGYYLGMIGMAKLQATVCACYVAYADDPLDELLSQLFVVQGNNVQMMQVN